MAKNKKKVRNKLKYEVMGLSLLALGLYSLYSILFENSGKIGKLIKFVMGFIIGKASLLIIILLLIISFYYIIKSNPLKWNKRLSALILLIVNYSIFLYIFKVEEILPHPFSMKIISVSWDNAPDMIGGGVVGLFLSGILVSLFSKIGTLIFLFLNTIIAFTLFTQKSISDFLKSSFNYIKEFFYKVTNNIKNFIYSSSNKNSLDSEDNDINNRIQKLDEKIKILDYTEEKELANKEIQDSFEDKQEKNLISETNIETSDKDKLEHPYINEFKRDEYTIPPLDMLNKPLNKKNNNDRKHILNNAKVLEKVLNDFGVKAKVVQVNMGPTITRYELQPSPGVKVSKILNLTDDIALNLASSGVRIEAPIPGKAAIGIEVPNRDISNVFIRELLESDCFKNFPSNLSFAVGKDIAGEILVTDLAKMPHLLIAGATGSGKSVCINSLITSILYKSTPDEVRLILIDPKVVELSVYNGIPHLLIPVVTDPHKASGALNWAVQEMNERYKKFSEVGVRDITRYNELVKIQDEGIYKLPQILVIIDELADLMLVSPHEVEDNICRLAQMARAAGIHLVVATQRPSVDIITGVIKANIPSRIAFAVSSQTDSRTILDVGGAEKLLGKGDMLFYPVGQSKPMRVQGAFISDKEVEKIVENITSQNAVDYDKMVIEEIQTKQLDKQDEDQDELLPEAIQLAIDNQQISISMLQRRLRIGYARAARIIDEMEHRNIIGGYEGSKPRKVLLSKEEYQE